MKKCMTYGLTKGQIDQIEESIKKFGGSYFGEGDIRYSRNVTDSGLLEVNVDDMMESISDEAWTDVKSILKIDLKVTIENAKVKRGELTKKDSELRIYKEPEVVEKELTKKRS